MDLDLSAEMYTGRKSPEGRAQPYRRFGTLADAVRFAVERQPGALMCTTIETEAQRLQGNEIRKVYESAALAPSSVPAEDR